MKRFLSFCTILLIAVSLQAQDNHLKFKGIPIEGNYKTFAQQLVQKGFKQIQSSQDGIALTGTFMAIPDVMVIVHPDPSSKVVSTVSAFLEAGDNWSEIEGKYNNVVDTYKEKYGEPTRQVEEFTTDVRDEDFFKKRALHDGQCDFKSLWEVEGGRIVISLMYFQYKNYVLCLYADEQNVKALHQTIIDDI